MQLKDVRTNQTFKLADFKGKVVVLESLTSACLQCIDQNVQLKSAQTRLMDQGQDVVFVSLDVDTSESEANLLAYLQRYVLPWRFAIATQELLKMLREDFGPDILNSSLTPIIILDKTQQPHLQISGLKGADLLLKEINKYL